ncbi:MAG: hydroxymethylbilane synthase [Alphaproteobacteria bacterium]|nr:hydroxymethylbilane synthase [Alphaproteobacteria bacterium]
MARPLRIGTRGSAMALYQANLVRDRLAAAHPALAAPDAVEIVVIRTTGDRVQNRLLAEIGGKGLFTKEIEEALLDRRVDLAVHSLKDMETVLPAGLAIVCVLPRDDPRDVLVTRNGARLDTLPPGTRIGTASLRRKAQLLRRRPDLAPAPIRGNVDTRLAKLAAGECDGLLLALCGLQRLGRTDVATEILPVEAMLPAVGQGALAIEARADDAPLRETLAPLHHAESAACVAAERAMLAALDGSCRTPIAGFADLGTAGLRLRALLLAPDGSAERHAEGSGAAADAAALGRDIGERLRRAAGPEFGLG